MRPNLFEVNFYFPKSTLIKNKQKFVGLIMEVMHNDGTIKYTGYSNEDTLRKDLLRHIGHYDCGQYRNLSEKEKQSINKTIQNTINKCNKILPLSIKIFIFVFPWFPSEKESVFNGSYGFTPYKQNVLHLFITPDVFTEESVANSVAHEINHVIWFYYHHKPFHQWTLLDYIINEGLAENFREKVLKTKSAPWSIALAKREAFRILKKIKHLLKSKNKILHSEIFFSSKKYKRWTGYSIGYWLIKEFIKKNKILSWKEIMKKKSENFLQSVINK